MSQKKSRCVKERPSKCGGVSHRAVHLQWPQTSSTHLCLQVGRSSCIEPDWSAPPRTWWGTPARVRGHTVTPEHCNTDWTRRLYNKSKSSCVGSTKELYSVSYFESNAAVWNLHLQINFNDQVTGLRKLHTEASLASTSLTMYMEAEAVNEKLL